MATGRCSSKQPGVYLKPVSPQDGQQGLMPSCPACCAPSNAKQGFDACTTTFPTVLIGTQVCGITATSFLPALEFDAYHLYSHSEVWAEAGLEEAVYHNGMPLDDVRISQKGVWLPGVHEGDEEGMPYLQIERSFEHSSSAAVLSTLVVFESTIGMLHRDVVTAKVLHPLDHTPPKSSYFCDKGWSRKLFCVVLFPGSSRML